MPRAMRRIRQYEKKFFLLLFIVGACCLTFAASAKADVLFGPKFTSQVGNSPRSVIHGDFNGDGILDIAVANTSSNTMSVLLGNGDGSYQAAVNYITGASPYAIAQGDFNGDGKIDLVVTNYLDGSISLFLGFGDGRFSSREDFYALAYPRGVTAGDFNGDGKLDIVVTNYFDSTITVLLGTGTGYFSAPVSFASGLGPQAIAAGDVNHDGKTDLVIVNDVDNTVTIHRGNGDGTFQPATAYGVGANPESVALGDLNGDGFTDIVVANADDNTVTVLLGNGDGSFQAPRNFGVGSRPFSVKIANINGDGKPDLVVANAWSNNVSVLLGNGNTLFDPAVHFASCVFSNAIAVGDVNRDGKDDVAVTCGSDTTLVSMVNATAEETSGSFNRGVYYEAGTFPHSIVTADFNHDGKLDLAVVNRSSNNVSIYFNTGHGVFAPAVNYAVGSNPWAIAAGDFNRDGNIDLAVTSPGTGSVAILRGNNDGTFAPAVNISPGGSLYGIVSVDANNDGRMDLIIADNANDAIVVLGGNGDGTFQAAVRYAAGTTPFAITAADLNRDGKIDLAVTNLGTGGGISILHGNGNGSFQSPVNYSSGPNPYSIVAGDFNLDGKIDLATANNGDGTISVLLGDETGSFPSRLTYYGGDGANFIATGDFNNDGKPDLIVANTQDYNNLYLLLGDGNGFFQNPILYESVANAYTRSIAVGDFDNNGTSDLAVTNAYANGISVLLNTDSTPDPFVFAPQSGVSLSTLVTSNSVTIAGINTAAPIIIIGGEYSVSSNGGLSWNDYSTTIPPVISRGDVVRVRQTSSSNNLATTNAVLTIGGISGTFGVTTVEDTTPEPFTFVDQTDVTLNTLTMSNSISVVGISSSASISITGGEYEINNSGIWTSTNGSINNSGLVRVRQTSSPNPATTTDTVLTIGGVSDTFSVTTGAAGGGGEGPIIEDFETGNLTKLPWTTGGAGVWTVTGTSVHGGSFAAEAPVSIGDYQTSYMEVSRSTGTGIITFWYSVSSEANFDFLRFYIDGIQQGAWSGFTGWTQQSYSVTAGVHAFRWEYTKDGSVSSGSDTAWIDDIVITAGSQPPAQCATALFPGPNTQGEAAISDLGEIVWSQYDPATGVNQIYSSTRGQLTFDPAWHDYPAMNNRGDVVWEQKFPWEQTGPIYGIISGQTVQVAAADGATPSVNDNQEIVWSRFNMDNGYRQIYSSRRNYLTVDLVDHWSPAINDAGDVVWTQNAQGIGWNQVYKLAAGTTTPAQVTSDQMFHWPAKISNSGEIVWSEGPMPGPGAGARVHSSTRGILTSDACPAGDDHFAPAVNACGDVIFTNMVTNFGTIYRLGNASPCVSDREPNNFLPEATLVSGNTTTIGMVQDPGDLEDWYKFTANAGDPITVTVNWSPTTAPNTLVVDLMDQYGGGLAISQPGSPKTITYTAMYSGTYHVHIMAMPGSRIGYTLTLKVGIGGGTCADPVSPGPNMQGAAAINDLGEMVWSQYDPATGVNQIYSSIRGQLTADYGSNDNPSINNRGDIVWQRGFEIFGLISGQQVMINSFGNGLAQYPSINDNQEIVWLQEDRSNGTQQVYSNRRGFLTSGWVNHGRPAINNAGDVVWGQPAEGQPWQQVYRLTAGTMTPVLVTSGPFDHWSPSISNTGEVVWSQGSDPMNVRVYSSIRGQLTFGCPAGERHDAPSVNACGDMTFTNVAVGQGTIYRLGNNSPCVAGIEPNNSMQEATLVSGNSTTTGILDMATNVEDWYRFTANAGDQISVTVNWMPGVPPAPMNFLDIALVDTWGGQYMSNGGMTTPMTLTATAPFSGTNYVRLRSNYGRFGYNLTVKVGIGGGACADPISPNSIQQQGASSINDLGEVVWTEYRGDFPLTTFEQIFSSTRGQLTFDPGNHSNPSLNNRGDVVWEQGGNIFGLLSGRMSQITYIPDVSHPSINDSQEIVWRQYDPSTGSYQVYSNRRGFLTSEPVNHMEPFINNAGDVVWMQLDMLTGRNQVYRLAAGTSQPIAVTSDTADHWSPTIGNTGEVVWTEGMPGSMRLHSNLRGQLTFDGCPGGMNHMSPAVNACGDLTFTVDGNGAPAVYRLGNNSPCVAGNEPNNSMQEATLVSGNSTTTGILDMATNVEDWYRFTANVGDQIYVTVNWMPGVPPAPMNFLDIALVDTWGGQIMSNGGMTTPMTLTATAPFSGTNYVRLRSNYGRFGYNLTVKVGIGNGACADPVLMPDMITPASSTMPSSSSQNDLGEVVWSQFDPMLGGSQIISSTRGRLTNDPGDRVNPSINNRGDVVWRQNSQVYGLISGQLTQLTFDPDFHYDPSINDSGEVVWAQSDASGERIYSSTRGLLTGDAANRRSLSLNNQGDVVWDQWDGNYRQVFGIISGVVTQLTSGPVNHEQPFISNAGEVVWSEGSDPMSTRIYKRSVTGQISQVTHDCPYGMGHREPSINRCGDVTFTSSDLASGIWTIYRLGNNSPCVAGIEPNNSMQEATLVSGNSTTTGILDMATNVEDWYRFTANAGDQIKVTVNWMPGVPPAPMNILEIALVDTWGGQYMSNGGMTTPMTLTAMAPFSGTNYVRLRSNYGRFGYSLTVKVGIGGGACADPVSPSMNMQDYGSGVNDLGEVVWSESIMDVMSGYHQIMSSTRGQLTSDPTDHMNPSVNNRGDVVWEQRSYDGNQWVTNIWGLISGQLQQLTFLGGNNSNYGPFVYGPSINDHQEVVWSQQNGQNWQIYSNQRGWLTSDPVNHDEAGINNAGDVVWSQMGQIYKLAAGTTTPVAVTSNPTNHMFPSISNSGEVVWSEDNGSGTMRIYSSTRGQVTFDGCPGGTHHGFPSVNACGDLTFTVDGNGAQAVYRLGNNSPCATDPEPNNSMFEATMISGNSTTTGMLNTASNSDMEDWYQFTANAGDPISVTVNWSPATPPNWLIAELWSAAGLLSVATNTGSPNTITYTAQYSGTYYAHLMAMPGSRIGYALTLKVGIGGGACADPVAPGGITNAINDLGEMVWSQFDWNTYRDQLYSSTRGQLTFDVAWNEYPSLNNRGDVVWEKKNNPSDLSGPIFGLISGQVVQLTADGNFPSINDAQEIVWSQMNNGNWQLYSNRRGYLTTDPVDHGRPSITNAGDVVWSQMDALTGRWQIYKLIAGSSAPVQLTSDAVDHGAPSISNTGEVVWSQGSVSGSRIHSSTRGQLTFDACPAGIDHVFPSINSCGDIVFSGNQDNKLPGLGFWRGYRLGNASPCVSDPEPNNNMSQATLISSNSTTIGMLDSVTDMEDWYQFTANVGDQITISVNWNNATPIMLITELTNASGVLAVAPESGSPKTITMTAPAAGTYYVHLMALSGTQIGYSLSVMVKDITPPTVSINPAKTPTNSNSQTISGVMEAGADVGVSINTSAVAGPVTYPTATTWSCTITGLIEGPNDITVTAADVAGNRSLAITSITVDTVAPSVTISSPVVGMSNVNAPMLSFIADPGILDVKVDGISVAQRSGQNLNVLPDGTHIVRVESTDTAGNIGFAEVTFVVDTLPPTVTVGPVTTPTKENTQTIGGGRENGALITVLVDTSASVGSVVYPTDTSWSSSVSGLAEGINNFTITAKDGVQNSASVTASISYDSIVPLVSMSSPVAGTMKNNSPLLTYTVSDGTVIVKVDGMVVPKISGTTLGPLADGSHIVRVEATDAAGNTGSAQVTFTIDTIPPSVSINPVISPTNMSSQTLTGTREENATVSVSVNTSASVGALSYPSSTTWSCVISNLATGGNTITVTAIDAAGNPATAAASIIFDSIAPTVSITSPGSAPTNDNTPLLTYSASDGSVVVKVDGVVISKVSGNSLNTLPDGSHTVRVESIDAAGNIGFAQVTFIVDTTPPAISIDPVTTPTKNSSQTITGTRENGIPVSVTVNTSATVWAISYPLATTWRCTISNFVRGSNVITARAVDAAGNNATDTDTITKK